MSLTEARVRSTRTSSQLALPQRAPGHVQALRLGLLRDAQEARRLQREEDLAKHTNQRENPDSKEKFKSSSSASGFRNGLSKTTVHMRVATVPMINIAAYCPPRIQGASKRIYVFKVIILPTDSTTPPAGRAPAECRSTP